MDTNSLIEAAKARFFHNSAKAHLKDKYDIKLTIASQNGLWRADPLTISLLNALTPEEVVLIDTFNNPVKVNRLALLKELTDTYNNVMLEWHNEWCELEGKR